MPNVQNEGENYPRVAQSSKDEEVPVVGSECDEKESTAHLSGTSLEIGGGEENLPSVARVKTVSVRQKRIQHICRG